MQATLYAPPGPAAAAGLYERDELYDTSIYYNDRNLGEEDEDDDDDDGDDFYEDDIRDEYYTDSELDELPVIPTSSHPSSVTARREPRQSYTKDQPPYGSPKESMTMPIPEQVSPGLQPPVESAGQLHISPEEDLDWGQGRRGMGKTDRIVQNFLKRVLSRIRSPNRARGHTGPRMVHINLDSPPVRIDSFYGESPSVPPRVNSEQSPTTPAFRDESPPHMPPTQISPRSDRHESPRSGRVINYDDTENQHNPSIRDSAITLRNPTPTKAVVYVAHPRPLTNDLSEATSSSHIFSYAPDYAGMSHPGTVRSAYKFSSYPNIPLAQRIYAVRTVVEHLKTMPWVDDERITNDYIPGERGKSLWRRWPGRHDYGREPNTWYTPGAKSLPSNQNVALDLMESPPPMTRPPPLYHGRINLDDEGVVNPQGTSSSVRGVNQARQSQPIDISEQLPPGQRYPRTGIKYDPNEGIGDEQSYPASEHSHSQYNPSIARYPNDLGKENYSQRDRGKHWINLDSPPQSTVDQGLYHDGLRDGGPPYPDGYDPRYAYQTRNQPHPEGVVPHGRAFHI